MRPVIELLRIMRSNIQLFRTGLCSWAWALAKEDLISLEEVQVLLRYIGDHPAPEVLDTDNFWWEVSEMGPRIEWINYHLKNDIDD
jgi:hypothetical protein